MMKYNTKLLVWVAGMLIVLQGAGQDRQTTWVDSVYRSLTPAQRVAQLLVVRAWSWKDSTYADSLVKAVTDNNLGGVCFFKGTPYRQAVLTNRLQAGSQTPLLVCIDAEWGLGMRLDSAFSYPRQMALGATAGDSMLYEMGRQVARGCRRLGVQVNLAPVADVNNNPQNPVINFRSFGEDPHLVARKSLMYMKGMQDEGIMSTAKHFPGHGDTETDSHLTLPVVNHPRTRLDSVELFPFSELIRNGADGIMIAHLYMPVLDTTGNIPTTLSKSVVTGLLRDQMGFKGYIVTDALDMQGVTKFYQPGEIEVRALQAGNDILLLPQNADSAIRGILRAVEQGALTDSLVEARCKRILALKYRLGLAKLKPVDLSGLTASLNPPEAEALAARMVKNSVTLVKNDLLTLPLTLPDKRRYAVLSLGDSLPTLFQTTLRSYLPMEGYNLPRRFPKATADSITRALLACDIVIAGIHGLSSNAADTFGLSRDMIRLLDTLCRSNRTMLTLFGTPYSMNRIPFLKATESLLVAYQDNEYTERAAAEAICGGIPIRGKLPVTAATYPAGTGETTEKTRLSHILPEEIGIPREALKAIDSIALEGLQKKAYPGCQVLLAKDGRIFYEKAFGSPRYGDTAIVRTSSLYDLASLTKVAATTLAIMKLYDEGKIMPGDTLGKFLPVLRGTDKGLLTVADVMTHQAGLQEWIPFYKATLRDGQPDPAVYRQEPSAAFPYRVAENLYIRADYPDVIIRQIINSPLRPAREYKYSDLGFILLRYAVEQIAGLPFDQYMANTFYKPLGLYATLFRPREHFSLDRLIPTEYDEEFRKQLVWGDVHDPAAAMLGGVAGHAGLFSDAYGCAVIQQMLLDGGTYGGKRFLSPKTVGTFTGVQFPAKGNRRGMGFDKPALNPRLEGPSCEAASPESYGHSGFTGTYIWTDPANGLVYVFLSNRVYPVASNQRLSQLNIRTRIHQAAYDVLERYRVK